MYIVFIYFKLLRPTVYCIYFFSFKNKKASQPPKFFSSLRRFERLLKSNAIIQNPAQKNIQSGGGSWVRVKAFLMRKSAY